MIRCGKCGKLYDYDKYNGICPVCARYNRPDSAYLEQELHRQYDSTPNVHSAEAHREVHRRNGETSGHRKKGKAAVICVIVIVVILIFVAAPLVRYLGDGRFSGMDFSVNRIFDDGEDDSNLAYEIHAGEAYVEYAWAQYAGEEIGNIYWGALSVTFNEGDEEDVAALSNDGSGAYYLVTLELLNNTDADLDMTAVEAEDLTFSLEQGVIPCQKVFYGYYDVIESGGGYGYLDCLIYLPDEWVNLHRTDGFFEVTASVDVGLDEPLPFTADYYFET